MRLHILLGVSLLSFSCEQCPGRHEPPATSTPVAASTPVSAPASAPAQAPAAAGPARFGEPLSAAEAVPAAVVLADPAKYDDKDLKLTGRVSSACQSKGCWMTVGNGEPGQPTVRVTFKDYGFFVPKGSMGKTAIVEGRFKVTTMSVAQAQHYADDAAKAGTSPQKITAPQRSLSLVASGVELL